MYFEDPKQYMFPSYFPSIKLKCEFEQDAFDSWGLFVSFLSIILLPIVGNATEHVGAIIFGFKNKLVPTLIASFVKFRYFFFNVRNKKCT